MQPGIFVSIDWGTSNFRMRLVEKDSLRILEQKTEPVGIKALYRQWQAEGGDRETRLVRFVEVADTVGGDPCVDAVLGFPDGHDDFF